MQHGEAAELAAEQNAMSSADSLHASLPANFIAKRAMQGTTHIATDDAHADSRFMEDVTNDRATKQIEEEYHDIPMKMPAVSNHPDVKFQHAKRRRVQVESNFKDAVIDHAGVSAMAADTTDIDAPPSHREGASFALPSGGFDRGAVTPDVKTAQCHESPRHSLLKARLRQVKAEATGRTTPNADAFYLFGCSGGPYDPEPLTSSWRCACVELEAGDYHKAVDDTVWSRFHGNLLHRIALGSVGIVVMHPPESTFDRVRRPFDEPYGRKTIVGKAKDDIRYETCLAQRACEVATTCMTNRIPFAYIRNVDSTNIADHERLVQAGCYIYIRKKHMIITNVFIKAGSDSPDDILNDVRYNDVKQLSPIPKHALVSDRPRLLKEVRHLHHLRGDPEQLAREAADAAALGGMRNPKKAMDRLPRLQTIGARMLHVVSTFLASRPAVERACLDAIGSTTVHAFLDPEGPVVDDLRRLMCRALGVDYHMEREKLLQEGPARTELCQVLWKAWVDAAGDPDTEVPDWLRAGAPAGIECHPKLKGIFPP